MTVSLDEQIAQLEAGIAAQAASIKNAERLKARIMEARISSEPKRFIRSAGRCFGSNQSKWIPA